jgi:hypothetical protein
VVARLDVEGVPARALGNDVVGIFGPGFGGATPRGYRVEVPEPMVPLAQRIIAAPPPPVDDDDTP